MSAAKFGIAISGAASPRATLKRSRLYPKFPDRSRQQIGPQTIFLSTSLGSLIRPY
jgi:hypothetical protein